MQTATLVRLISASIGFYGLIYSVFLWKKLSYYSFEMGEHNVIQVAFDISLPAFLYNFLF